MRNYLSLILYEPGSTRLWFRCCKCGVLIRELRPEEYDLPYRDIECGMCNPLPDEKAAIIEDKQDVRIKKDYDEYNS